MNKSAAELYDTLRKQNRFIQFPVVTLFALSVIKLFAFFHFACRIWPEYYPLLCYSHFTMVLI